MKFSFFRGLTDRIPWDPDLNGKGTVEIQFSLQKSSLKHEKVDPNMKKNAWQKASCVNTEILYELKYKKKVDRVDLGIL